MKAQDWSSTALGPVPQWPENLKAPLRLMLASPVPSFIWWGRELIHLHNDACAALLGRSRAIGRPASEVRRDIWQAVGAEVRDVMASNSAVSAAERRIVVNRNGREIELYCTFSLTPIRDEWGAVLGVFGIGTDDTPAVLARQRLAALRSLEDIGNAKTPKAAAEWAAAALATHARDVAFAMVYLADGAGDYAALTGSAGALPQDLPAALPRDDGSSPWPLQPFDRAEPLRQVLELPAAFREAAPQASGAAVLPLRAGPACREGYLIVGLAARRPLDDDYRAFLTAAAGIVASGLAAATKQKETQSREVEEERRNEFLAMLAHELRNPLAPIRSAAELLAYVESNPMTLAQARAIIERQLAQLVRLVDDLLDASRISRGKLELKRSPLDLRTAVAGAVESARPLIDAARHELDIRMPERQVLVHGDHARLTQAIANLLTNAAQYTDVGGHIGISVHALAREVRLEVVDDGIGIDTAMLPRLFEMFTQGDQRSDQPRHGLGIGLAVARRLIDLHGGSIVARSAGRGRGSEFTVTLPLLESKRTAPRTQGKRKSNGHDSAGRRILVADDNQDAAAAMAEILGVIGHEVRTAEDGVEAIEIAETFRPELILLDIGMPRLDGFEACRRIRQRAWGRDVAIYAVTGWGQPADRRRTREAGFNAHLVKPVSIAAIKELIARRDH